MSLYNRSWRPVTPLKELYVPTDEMKRIERSAAELFLSLYNPMLGTAYAVVDQGETPDVTCSDPTTSRELFLEVSLLENIPGEIAHELGRRLKPISETTGTTAVSLRDDVYPTFRRTIAKKLLSSYGPNTALVLRQVSILWEPCEWELMATEFRNEVLQGKENNFGAGAWV